MDCIFCRIVTGDIAATIVYQDTEFVAFRDIRPQAPIHLLIIPKAHIPSLSTLTEKQQGLAGNLILLATQLAKREGLAPNGYRLTINCGTDGGQLVPHLHLHIIGGRKLNDELG